jgi:hypothetical protein
VLVELLHLSFCLEYPLLLSDRLEGTLIVAIITASCPVIILVRRCKSLRQTLSAFGSYSAADHRDIVRLIRVETAFIKKVLPLIRLVIVFS